MRRKWHQVVCPRRYEYYANAPLCYVIRTLSIFIVLLVWPQLICVIHIASFKQEYITCTVWNRWLDCDYYRYVREFHSTFLWKKQRQRRVPQKNVVECTKARAGNVKKKTLDRRIKGVLPECRMNIVSNWVGFQMTAPKPWVVFCPTLHCIHDGSLTGGVRDSKVCAPSQRTNHRSV
jgi:hypothetical protein